MASKLACLLMETVRATLFTLCIGGLQREPTRTSSLFLNSDFFFLYVRLSSPPTGKNQIELWNNKYNLFKDD